ncbi:RNA-directed DNA polymerase from mobile element jockey-like [Elysia marginata]|uniref:RNA-directed DNA polymerase from mobile element jockey-like n=1 Tax=Elysia marginata TaxID=1093978 RepID=A0AAV4JDE5_9GAST|nr:RNA-directed DNA polymerase from mobile element jockey-like [Elysia marginata]
MSHAGKILLRNVMTRIRSKTRPEVAESKFGFVPDKGTPNAIFTLPMLMERAVEVQRDVYLCFINYSKAFDKVKHSELLGILNQLNIDGKDIRIFRNLYWEQVAAIRIDGEYTDFTEIKIDGNALRSVVTYESESMRLQLIARKMECRGKSNLNALSSAKTQKSNKRENLGILVLQFPEMLNVIKKLRKE